MVVPVFNGELFLTELCQRLSDTLHKLSSNFEIILVDDYSQDNSWEVIKELKNQFPLQVKGIKLARNYGQHNATLCGIKHAQASVIITIDDDLEFQPEDMLKLYDELRSGNYDVVYGVNKDKKTVVIRDLLTDSFRSIQKATVKNYHRGSSFRIITERIGKAILTNARDFSFIDEFILWHTNKISSIEVSHNKNNQPSKSRYKVSGLAKITKNLILISSSTPIYVVTNIGFFMMIFNFLLGLILIYRRFVLIIDVKGYTSLIVAILFTSGLILFSIGIIAEYIGKVLLVNYKKPAYFEDEII